MTETVRLDVWLDVACLFKTRSEAQRACKLGRVTVNGQLAKPHRDLRIGDQVVVVRSSRKQILVVVSIADRHVAKSDARAMYEDHTPAPSPEQVEHARLERQFRAVSQATRLDRRTQRDVARGKFRS